MSVATQYYGSTVLDVLCAWLRFFASGICQASWHTLNLMKKRRWFQLICRGIFLFAVAVLLSFGSTVTIPLSVAEIIRHCVSKVCLTVRRRAITARISSVN